MPHGWARPPCHPVHLPIFSYSIRERSCCLRLSWKEQMSTDRNIRCVLRDTGDDEAAEPRRPRLEPESRLDLNLGISEFDQHAAAPAALTKGEEEEEEGGYDRRLFLAHNSFICEDEESKWMEQAIAAAFARQERLEAEVKQACSRLVSQASVIEGLEFRLEDRGKQIQESLLAATMKEDDIERRRNEFMKRNERAATMGGDITSRVLLLHEADGLVNKQEHELERLWESVRRKEEEVEASSMLRKEKEGEVNAAESFLEERMREWLLALEELRQLVNKVSRWVIASDEASLESFIMLKRLVLDVCTELIVSWRSVASSRQKLEDDVHKVLFERKGEIKEEKESLALYTARLKEAQQKLESERIQLVVAEAQHEELKRELLAEQQLIEELQEDLARDRVHLEQVAQDVSLLQAELDGRTEEYLETQELLRVKELELAEANLKIQHLDSERHALWRMLEDEDLQLLNTRKELKNAFLEVPDSRKRIDQKETTDLQIVQSKQNKPSDVLGQTVDLLPHGPEISKDKQEQDQHLVYHPSSGEIEAATTDLRKLTEACRQLLDRTHVVPDSSTLNVTESSNGSGRVIHKILTEITQLMALSEQLIAEAELQ